MEAIGSLVKRNVLLYIRDRGAVFFSLLSMLIVIGLMVVFLGSMNSEGIVEVLNEYGGIRDQVQDQRNAVYLVQMWTIAGILVVNAVTVTSTMIGFMVRDEEVHKLASFYATPISKMKVALGYILAAMVVGSVMCILTLVVSEVYIAISGGELLGIVAVLKILGLIEINVFAAACVMFLIGVFTHTNSAWSGVNTIIGTLVGFVGAIYLPMGLLPEGVQKILKCFPILYGASLMREICTKESLAKTFEGLSGEVVEETAKQMGIIVEVGGHKASALWQILFLVGCGIMAIIIGVLMFRKNKGYSD